ncbi:MAG: glycine cleavage T C-terminal barrel domain-containing protein [Tateyamaria sp.]|uniref:glycine cleavage T C-terminal barrel domain-containing protein n=1 Tax=Tateyamaria sp. TaxID=1929288 RepID=UPI00329F2464
MGSTASAAYSPPVGRILAFAYIKPHAATPGTAQEVVTEGASRRTRVLDEPAFGPQSLRPRTKAAMDPTQCLFPKRCALWSQWAMAILIKSFSMMNGRAQILRPVKCWSKSAPVD